MAEKKVEEVKKNVVTADDEKWGRFGGGCLVGESYVPLFIPKDKMNPTNAFWFMLNGDDGYLAVGEKIRVPESIAELYNHSYTATQEAEEKINTNMEIK